MILLIHIQYTVKQITFTAVSSTFKHKIDRLTEVIIGMFEMFVHVFYKMCFLALLLDRSPLPLN